MRKCDDQFPFLELLPQPAFCVTEGKITQLNSAAAARMLSVGEDILPLLVTGAEEYESLREGCLYLSLSIAGKPTEATVIFQQTQQLFVLERSTDSDVLQALALAAQELRTSLTGMFSAAGQIIPPDANQAQIGQYNRRAHQLMRIISNMSDAACYCEATAGRMESTELCVFLEELLEKAQLQLLQGDIHLQYTLPATPIYTLADREKLERALYNMISNAAKHTAPGGSLTVELIQKGRLYLSVTDSGYGSPHPGSDSYYRYLRAPSLSDGTEGLGLGMVLIRATAALHNGVVLIRRTEEGGTCVTMTLEQIRAKTAQVRSPIFYPDYAGERDHALQELADVLPASLYAAEPMF